jgi:hypothetical protein
MRRIPLRAYLAPLQRDRLQAIAEALGLPVSRELIPTIAATLKDPVRVESLIAELPGDAVQLLRSLCYSETLHIPIRDQAFGSAPAFSRLQALGLAGMGKEYWGTLRVVLPDETTGILLELFMARDAAALAGAPANEVTQITARADAFLRNATTLIAIAEKETIPLTSKGDIAKSFLAKKLLPLLELGSYPAPLDGRYPFDFLQLHDFCCYCGILHRQGQAIVAGETAESFLEAEEAEIGRAIVAFAANAHERLPIAWLATLLGRLEPGGWVSLDRVVSVCQPDGLNKREIAEYRRLWHDAAVLLEAVGLLDSGMDASGTRAVRLGRLMRLDAVEATQAEAFIVTPDFKISAPRNLKSLLRREISRTATLVKSDMMDQWELTRENVCRAIDEGKSAEAILKFLADHSSTPLPRNVIDSVNSWEKTHADIRYHEGPMLIVDNPAEAAALQEILQKEGALLGRPAETVFLLHPKRAEAALARIRSRRTIGRVNIPEARKRGSRFSEIVEKLEKTREKPIENGPGVHRVTM